MKHKAYCQDYFGGSVEGLSLLDVMQMLHWSKATSIIFFHTETLSGLIHFFEGEVIHAETDTENGLVAFYTFVQQDHGLFRVKTAAGKSKKITITDPFKKLMLESVQYFDEKLKTELTAMGQISAFPGAKSNVNQIEKQSGGGVVQPFPKAALGLHDLDSLCETIIESESDLLACSVIDLARGIPLGVCQKMHSITPVSYVNAIVDNVLSLFRSEHIDQMAVVLTGDSGWDYGKGLEELYFRVGHLDHFMKAIPEQNTVVVIAMKHSVNMALGWITLRRIIRKVADSLPQADENVANDPDESPKNESAL